MCATRLSVSKPLSPYLSHIIFLLVQAPLTLAREVCRLLKSNPVTLLVPWRRNVPGGKRLTEEKGRRAHIA